MKKRLLLVDFANSFYTHFHYKSSDKTYEFLNNIRKILTQYNIDQVLFLPEGGKSKYRLAIHPDYKMHRARTREKQSVADQEAHRQFIQEEMPECLALADKLGIKQIKVKGVECDDAVSYLIRHIDLDQYNVMLLSTDKDFYQLLRPGVVIGGYNKNVIAPLVSNHKIPRNIWLNSKNFIDQYEIQPHQYADVKALAGDSSDGYASVKGVGDTLSLKMIQQYGSIQEVEKNLDTIKISRLSQKVIDELKANYKVVYHNYRLANLNHTPETDLEIFGEEGLEYLNNEIANLEERLPMDKEAFTEYCYETGRITIVDKIDSWLSPFSGN